MIELNARGDELVFSFPGVHPEACLKIAFNRTLRIPDDGREYPLPPGLGKFPMRPVDDFGEKVSERWVLDGGVVLPMHQAEATWLYFDSDYVDGRGEYPFAVKISTGKVSAVSGGPMRKGLNMEPQDYVVVPGQPWLDGYNVGKGTIRQFVAMPLGRGYSAEEQLTGAAAFGGLQLLVYPMKRAAFEKRFPKRPASCFCIEPDADACMASAPPYMMDMGLAPGGRMRQEILEDRFDPEEWDLEHYSHCFVHIANSESWRALTGKNPPTVPPTAEEYALQGLPWFEHYAEEGAKAVEGAAPLKGLKSVGEVGEEKNENPLPAEGSLHGLPVFGIGRGPRPVREGGLEERKPDKKEGLVKKGYTHVTVILDRSGSMESVRDDTVGGINTFLEQQKAGPGEATLTLVQFDTGDPYEVIHRFRPIGEVPPLTTETYVPRGGTPLLDALGRGINDIDSAVAGLGKGQAPEKVVVAVVTDGQENSSREFGKEQVREMVRRKTGEGWRFIFLSADLDAIDDAVSLGFRRSSTASFDMSGEGVHCCMSMLSDSVCRERAGNDPDFGKDPGESSAELLKKLGRR